MGAKIPAYGLIGQFVPFFSGLESLSSRLWRRCAGINYPSNSTRCTDVHHSTRWLGWWWNL